MPTHTHTIPRPLTPNSQHRATHDWNTAYPIGTAVTVRKDDGSTVTTKTQSAAWVLGGHTAVINLEGITGAYLLSRVKPVHPANQKPADQ
jgi:hypothetical protein